MKKIQRNLFKKMSKFNGKHNSVYKMYPIFNKGITFKSYKYLNLKKIQNYTSCIKISDDNESLDKDSVNMNDMFKMACSHGDTEIVEKLIQRGFYMSSIDDTFALQIAAKHGHIGIIKFFVPNACKVNTIFLIMRTAIQYGHVEMVKYLMQQNVEFINNDIFLLDAYRCGHLDIIKILESKIDMPNTFYYDALRIAASGGHLNVVKHIATKGINVHANNYNALRLASYNGKTHVVNYLVNEHGNACPFLLKWAISEKNLELVKYLIQKMQNFHINDDVVLEWACQTGHLRTVEYLVEKRNADVNVAFVLASNNGHLNIVKYLVDKMDQK